MEAPRQELFRKRPQKKPRSEGGTYQKAGGEACHKSRHKNAAAVHVTSKALNSRQH